MSEHRLADAELVAEVLRINDRYTSEFVERFNICPYARGARVAGRTGREVLLQCDETLEPSLALIAALEAASPPLDVVQLIYPCMALSPRDFERFNTRLREAHAATRRNGAPVYVHAAFHPEFGFDDRSPEALVAFIRRAPDPTIQLVRYGAIESIRGERSQGTMVVDLATVDLEALLRGQLEPPPLSPSERIARDNHVLVQREGREKFEAIFAEISADRARSYGSLSPPIP